MYSAPERRMICPKRGPWLKQCPCPPKDLNPKVSADWLSVSHDINSQTINSFPSSLDTPGFIALKYAEVGAGAERDSSKI